MKRFSDFDIHDFGNTIQIVGFVLKGNGNTIAVPFPDEILSESELVSSARIGGGVRAVLADVMEMSSEEWTSFLYQTDILEVELQWPKKAVIRKSQRQIDQNVAWEVFRRDGYKCRYCGKEVPLSVDHIDLYENGGAAAAANLISSCRKCNRTRGSAEYAEWLKSPYYLQVSQGLSDGQRSWNESIVAHMDYLKTLRVDHVRSR